MTSIQLILQHDITLQRVQDLLVSAFEGGSGYWIDSATINAQPPVLDVKMEGMKEETIYNVPVNKGGIIDIKVYDYDQPVEPLTLETIKAGLKIMAVKYPHHFKNFLEENDDAETADVFLQCCILKDVIFG